MTELSAAQRKKFLQLITANKGMGTRHALREAGFKGTLRAFDRLLADDEDLRADYEHARGRDLDQVEATAWDVAKDTEHPSWFRANQMVLRAWHPAYRDQSRVELTGADGGPVEMEDRSASLAEVLRVIRAAGAEDGGGAAGGEMADA